MVNQHGDTLTSHQPTEGTSAAWTVTDIDGSTPLQTLACPLTTFCVATDDDGHVLTTRHPFGGASAWTVTDAGFVAYSLSCPATTLCVAGASGGDVYTSTNPQRRELDGNERPTRRLYRIDVVSRHRVVRGR